MRTKLLTTLMAFLVSLALTDDATAEEASAALRFPLELSDLTDSEPGPTFGRLLYLEVGVAFEHDWFWIDGSTPMPIVLVDGIASAIKYLAGGSEDFFLFDGLNPEEEQPGWVRAFEGSFGPRIAKAGSFRFGAGAYLAISFTFPRFGGERVNHGPFDTGVALRAWRTAKDWNARLELRGGNGWHDYGNVNPFVELAPSAEFRVFGMLGGYIGGRIGYRGVDYTQFDETRLYDGPLETIRVRSDHLTWAIELGPTIMF